MTHRTQKEINKAHVIGIDLGDTYSYLHTLDNNTGETLEHRKLETSSIAFETYFQQQPSSSIVIEAGLHSPWVNQLLNEVGHKVIVANPAAVALIHKSHRKSDEHDAEKLARLGRFDPSLLSPIKHRSLQVSADRTA